MGELTIIVQDAVTGEPLSDATVQVFNGKDCSGTSQTDNTGISPLGFVTFTGDYDTGKNISVKVTKSGYVDSFCVNYLLSFSGAEFGFLISKDNLNVNILSIDYFPKEIRVNELLDM